MRSWDSHRDRLSPCTLAFGCPSPRTEAHRTQAEGCCTVVSWPVFLSRRSHCTGSTAATPPSYQPLDEQKGASDAITPVLEQGAAIITEVECFKIAKDKDDEENHFQNDLHLDLQFLVHS